MCVCMRLGVGICVGVGVRGGVGSSGCVCMCLWGEMSGCGGLCLRGRCTCKRLLPKIFYNRGHLRRDVLGRKTHCNRHYTIHTTHIVVSEVNDWRQHVQ